MRKFIYFIVSSMISVQVLAVQTAKVQVIHNSADKEAEKVDIYLNGSLLFDDFMFRTASSFSEVPAGIELNIGVAPGTSNSVDDTIKNFTYTLEDGEKYVLIANGMISTEGYSNAPAFNIDVYPMGREMASTGGNTDVLIYHGSTDAPVVDIYANGSVELANDIAYSGYNGAGYLELSNADYTIQVKDETASSTVAAYSAPLQTLGLADSAIVVVASGFLAPGDNSNGPVFGLFAVLPSGGDMIALPASGSARVQVIHNSADAAAGVVDVYLNDGMLIDDFTFRHASSYIDAPASAPIKINVVPPGSVSSGEAIYTMTATLADGGTYVLVANGIVSESGYSPSTPFGIDVYDMGREAASETGNTDLMVVHGSTDAPVVDVVEVSDGAANIVNNLEYSDFSGYLGLPTADYALNIRDESGRFTVAAYDAPLSTLGLEDAAVIAVAGGFLDPATNSNGPGFGVYVATPGGGEMIPLPASESKTARVQVIHNSADAAATSVDVYLDGDILVDDFAFRTATQFIDAPAGVSINVGIAPASSSSVDDTIKNITYTLEDGEKYVLIANGMISASGYDPIKPFAIDVFAMGREAATEAGNTDILVYHGSTDAPVVDIFEASGPTSLVDNIGYNEFSEDYLELTTANYEIEVRTDDGSSIVESYSAPLEDLSLNDGAIVVVASGFLTPSVNNDGAGFGLWVALPGGGNLVELPLADATTIARSFNKKDFRLYPNPATGLVNVEMNLEKERIVKIELFNSIGMKVYDRGESRVLAGFNTFPVDLKGLESGVYFMVVSVDQEIYMERFIVR